MKNRLLTGLVLATLLASPMAVMPALAAPACSESENSWVPTRYYARGAVTFYRGDWYRSQERHEGREPGQGAFAWQRLEEPPACAAGPDQSERRPEATTPPDRRPQETTRAEDKQPQTSDTAEASCPELPAWSFAGSYSVGDQVLHEGQVYRAIRQSNGTLPGSGHPPRWQPMSKPCRNMP
ncbi:hypothetical protein [uncultured Marinobacter sp.]|uniref:hypothetical protein n=1 Tax=uncultured Marinobacter sp. TaxID=187379 RepID=UPI0026169514|nr:hypothetical protein [uncultured Marinobacter sp.]